MDFLKEVGTTEVARDSLKIEVNRPASWSAQDLRTRPVIPSGPAAFLMFTPFSALRTSVLRHGDHMILASLPAASWRAARQSRDASVAFKAAVEECLIFGQRRICSHLRGGFVSKGTDGP